MLRLSFKSCRPLLLVLLAVAAQSTLFLHQQDLSLHGSDTNCSICLHAQSAGGANESKIVTLRTVYCVHKAIVSVHDEIVAEDAPPCHLTRAPPAIFS